MIGHWVRRRFPRHQQPLAGQWHALLYPARLVMVAMVASYFAVQGLATSPLAPVGVYAALAVYATALLALGVTWRWAALTPRHRDAVCALDNAMLAIAVAHDPATGSPLIFLFAVNPLEWGVRYGLVAFRNAVIGAALGTALMLALRHLLIPAGLTPDIIGGLLVLGFAIPYALTVLYGHFRARGELELARETLDLATRETGIGTFSEDRETGTRFWDARTRKLLGVYSGFDGGFDQIFPRVHDDDRAAVHAAARALLRDGTPCSLECRLLLPDGRLRTLSARCAAVVDATTGRVRSVAGTLWDVTEARVEQQRLRQSLADLAIAQRAAGASHWRVDAEHLRFDLDKQWKYMVGWPPGQPAPSELDDVMDVIVEEDRPLALQTLHEAFQTGRTVELTFRVRRVDNGDILHTRVRAEPIADRAGRVTALSGFLIDETDQARARQEIQRLQTELQRALTNTRSVAFTTNADLTRGEFVGDVRHLLGLPDGPPLTLLEALGHVHPDDQPVMLREAAQAATDDAMDFLFRVDHAGTGQPQWFRAIGRGQSVDGEPRVTGIITDVTARETARREAESLRGRVEAAIANAPVGPWTVWPAQDRVEIHPALMRLLEAEPDDFDGTIGAFIDMVYPPDRDAVAETLGPIMADGRNRTVRFRRRLPDGRLRWLQGSGEATAWSDGQVTCVAGTTYDITEVMEAREALARSNAELDDFAHIASHDLREPLRGMQNYARFLIEDYADVVDDAGRDMLHGLASLAERLQDLVGGLQHYARVGRTEMNIKPTDLDAVLDGVLETLAFSVKEAGVQIRRPQPLPTWTCDGRRIGEVLRNLVTNAVKYNDKPDKWVEIGVRDNAIYVADNGIGISADHVDRVFTIFRRLHGRNAYGGGTGAGLTLARRIVERHGGRLWLESTPGEGTTFYVRLDEADAPDGAATVSLAD